MSKHKKTLEVMTRIKMLGINYITLNNVQDNSLILFNTHTSIASFINTGIILRQISSTFSSELKWVNNFPPPGPYTLQYLDVFQICTKFLNVLYRHFE